MGTYGNALFGRTRSALLALLYGHTDQSFYQRQLIRTIGAGHGAIQRELKQLTDMGLIVRKIQGNQTLYRANAKSPIFTELRRMITKTSGTHDAVRSALAPLESDIEVAFAFGSITRHSERAGSDVDLLIIGDAAFADIVTALAQAQKRLGREINPNVFPVAEFRSKLSAGNHFLRSVMKEKKLFVLGSEHELKRLAAK